MICNRSYNRYHSLFEDIVNWDSPSLILGISVISLDTFKIELSYPNKFFLHYLTIFAISPTHKNCQHTCAGPYYLDQRDSSSFLLKKNKHYKLSNHSNITRVKYTLIHPSNMLKAYRNKAIHISCDTGMYYHQILKLKETGEAHILGGELIMLLTAGTKYLEMHNDIKANLSRYINRRLIAKSLLNIPRPAYSYRDIYEVGESYTRANIITPNSLKIKSTCNLEIAYENFYPNYDVLKYLKIQLAKFNINIIPVREEYGTRSVQTHLRLEIRKSLNSTPVLLYKADLARHLLKADEQKLAHKCYSLLLQKGDNNKIYDILDDLLISNAISIPLLSIPKISCISSGIDPNTVYTCDPIRYGVSIHDQT